MFVWFYLNKYEQKYHSLKKSINKKNSFDFIPYCLI